MLQETSRLMDWLLGLQANPFTAEKLKDVLLPRHSCGKGTFQIPNKLNQYDEVATPSSYLSTNVDIYLYMIYLYMIY